MIQAAAVAVVLWINVNKKDKDSSLCSSYFFTYKVRMIINNSEEGGTYVYCSDWRRLFGRY
jgi:hypothetical protein